MDSEFLATNLGPCDDAFLFPLNRGGYPSVVWGAIGQVAALRGDRFSLAPSVCRKVGWKNWIEVP